MMLFVIEANAQDAPSKFGKISEEELSATVCPIDSNAHAYYVFDCGQVNFIYPQTTIRSDDPSSNSGFVMITKRHFRIKVIDETAHDIGNIEIALYSSGNNEEKLLDIDAASFNIEGKKIIKSKFEKKNILTEAQSKNWKVVKIPMPNVKSGTVIDVQYSIKSDFYFNLNNWRFQHSVPVLYSKYVTYIPEYFSYHKNVKGYFPLKVENTQKRNSIRLTYVDNGLGAGLSSNNSALDNGRTTSSHTFEYEEYVDSYTGHNIPAFVEDDYLKSKSNYLSEVEFELAFTKFPNSPIKSYTSKWENVVNELLDDDNFGVKLKRTEFLNDFVKTIPSESLTKPELIRIAFDYIKGKMKWNELYKLYVNETLKKTYNDGVGSSADINLCLVGLLEKFGLEAYPVVISTQSNGFISLTHPTVTDFNYVIALVRFEGKNFLMDATEPLSRINQLPIRCLNDKGLIVKKDQVEWVDLTKSNSYKDQTTLIYTFDKDLNINASYNQKLDGYAAYLSRMELKKHSSADEFVEHYQKSVPGLNINSHQISGIDSLDAPLTYNLNVSLTNYVEAINNLVLITPLLFETPKSSPFKLSKRDYPVEYSYPLTQFYSAQIDVPENYTVETLPKSVSIALPDKQTKFTYNLSLAGNKIIVTSIFVNNKLQFLPNEYNDLKEFYRLMIEKQNEKIILKLK